MDVRRAGGWMLLAAALAACEPPPVEDAGTRGATPPIVSTIEFGSKEEGDSTAASRRSDDPDAGGLACVVARDGIRDGDTLRCADGPRVRLLMIDAPELGQGASGDAAVDALRALAPPGTRVRLETDVRERDQFERLLAYAWLPDGRMVNEEMARSGYAVALVYPPNVRHADRIRAAVRQARAARRGLWAEGGFECEPREWRAGRCGR
ncbi:thermonuclease family protein [Longimicrobium sp.]|uniref:thermonuclease family protein n=1 Tax=Longimicrobium sp. TaxID=2029185 RepID=UPI002F923D2E